MSFDQGDIDPTVFTDPTNPQYLNYVGKLVSFLSLPDPWENSRAAILGVVVTIMVLSGFCILFRLYVRLKVVHSAGLDDVFVTLFLVTTTANTIATCLAPENGLGQHILLVSPDQLRSFLIYLRLYERKTRAWWFTFIVITLVSLWGISFAFIAWVPCFPIHVFWDFKSDRKCYGFGAPVDRTTYIIHTSTNMAFDLTVFAIPVPYCFKRTTSKKSKMAMLCLLLLGSLAILFAAWRLAKVLKSLKDPATALDPTFFTASLILLAVLEIGTASICASIPIFWPIVKMWRLDTIFVTHEVEVVHEERDSHTHLRSGSASTSHYDNTFVMGQVDPFTSIGTTTYVHSDGRPPHQRKESQVYVDEVKKGLEYV